jgi:hypothetical protein
MYNIKMHGTMILKIPLLPVEQEAGWAPIFGVGAVKEGKFLRLPRFEPPVSWSRDTCHFVRYSTPFDAHWRYFRGESRWGPEVDHWPLSSTEN